MKINVIKGFTVPPGYTLRITQDDGNVLEKRPGEQSGGHYSFEQVVQGIDPDWELSQDTQQTVGIVQQTKQQEPLNKDSFAFVKPEMFQKHDQSFDFFDALTDLDTDRLSNYYSDDVIQVLSGVTREMRKALFVANEGDVDKLKEISVEEILTHPMLDILGGYMTSEEILNDSKSLEHKITDYTTVAENGVRIQNRNVQSFALEMAMAVEWDKLRPQTREKLYGNDFLSYRDEKRGGVYNSTIKSGYEYPAGTDTSFEQQKFLGRNADSILREYLPSLYDSGTVYQDEVKSLLNAISNPWDAQKVISNLPVFKYYDSIFERDDKIKEYIENGTVGNAIHDRLIALDIEIDTLYDRGFELSTKFNSGTPLSDEEKKELHSIEYNRNRYQQESRELQMPVDRAIRNAFLSEGYVDLVDYQDNYSTNKPTFENVFNIDEALSFMFGFVHPSNREGLSNKKVHVNFSGDTDRAYYYRWGVNGVPDVTARENESKDTLVHEFGHFLEDHSPDIQSHVARFLVDRIPKDEPLQKLKDLVGAGYKDDEVTFKDKFSHSYIGKFYGMSGGVTSGTFEEVVLNARSGSTEVISMGLQMMYQDPRALAKADPSFFSHIWQLRNPLKRYVGKI